MIDATERVDEAPRVSGRLRTGSFLELTKPRLNALILLTTFVGYFLGARDGMDGVTLFHVLGGTYAVAGGAAALNQAWERLYDARMARTRGRPVPSGRVEHREAILFGVGLILAGVCWLWFCINLLTALLGLASAAIYVLIYTPMKARSAWNTLVGAISGALPPVMGWTGAGQALDATALLLFAVLFFWQFPHFFALGWRYREEYQKGGFQMLASVDPKGATTAWLMTLGAAACIPSTALLTPLGVTGMVFLYGGMVLGLWYTWACAKFLITRDDALAKRAFFVSLAYLPAVLLLMMIDAT